jgi:hypothetical protein
MLDDKQQSFGLLDGVVHACVDGTPPLGATQFPVHDGVFKLVGDAFARGGRKRTRCLARRIRA